MAGFEENGCDDSRKLSAPTRPLNHGAARCLESKDTTFPAQPTMPPRQISSTTDEGDHNEGLQEWMKECCDLSSGNASTHESSTTPDLVQQITAMLEHQHNRISQAIDDKLTKHHSKLSLHISALHEQHQGVAIVAAATDASGRENKMWGGFEHPPVPHHGPPVMLALAVQEGFAKELTEVEQSRSFKALKEFKALTTQAKIQRVVSSTSFEICMGFVILMHAVVMMATLQLKGEHEAYKLGLQGVDGWSDHKLHFELLEAMFNVIYLVELTLRFMSAGKSFLLTRPFLMHWLDVGVVFTGCMESFVLLPFGVTGMINISVLRLIRMSRIFRVLKFLHLSEHFTEMRVLLRTLQMAMRGVGWSFVLLGTIILVGGILMTQMAEHFLTDVSLDNATKVWLFENFGTTTRSSYTMFECTFTGTWTRFARPLIEDVSAVFAVFWIAWILGVNFMTMKVVAAIFMKHTFAVASLDQEQVAMDNKKRKEEYAKELMVIFHHADTSGDGAISKDEFEAMLLKPAVVQAFEKIGLDTFEVATLFDVLSSDDGDADYEEFLEGALKMTSSTYTLDAVQVMHNQMKMSRDLDNILSHLQPPSKMNRSPAHCSGDAQPNEDEPVLGQHSETLAVTVNNE